MPIYRVRFRRAVRLTSEQEIEADDFVDANRIASARLRERDMIDWQRDACDDNFDVEEVEPDDEA